MCNKCEKCCKEMILEVYELDLIREPKLLEYVKLMDGDGMGGKIGYDSILDREYVLPSPCPFVVDNKCSIYSSRPNMCVAFNHDGNEDRCKGNNNE